MTHPEHDIQHLLAIMQKLRDPGAGCPWDLEQTFETIAPYTIEEAYEVDDAIQRGDMNDLKEELGDLLLQVIFHSQMAQEKEHFNFSDVVKSISNKMITRHPHVFEEQVHRSSEEQTNAWEIHKEQERAHKSKKNGNDSYSAVDGVALSLPALLRAHKLQKRAARVGFDWPDISGPLSKITEEASELVEATNSGEKNEDEILDEFGDLLFSLVNLSRFLKIDPERALRRSTSKFEHRFKHVELIVSENGQQIKDLSIEELDKIWDTAKKAARLPA